MKFKLKSIILAFFFLLTLSLTACKSGGNEQVYVLPDLSGKTIQNYKETLNSSFITVVERKENHSTIPVDQFTKYGDNLKPGSEVKAGTMVYVYFSKGPAIVKQPDTVGPQIVGADAIDVAFASSFDPYQGVTVTDNVDNDLLDRLIVTGTVNLYKLGAQTIKYTVMDKSGNLTEIDRVVTVVPSNIDTRYTDSLQLTKSYAGKNFLTDGIGVATFNKCVDGDTANFTVSGERISVRFLGINTPESTYKFEPWGKPASRFTCDKLTNATTVVLERENANTVFDSTGTRYLAWVWVDGRLLNLELVEQAFTTSTGATESQYAQVFYDADRKTQGTKKRIWGEIDPEHDYELDDDHVTPIQDLRENYEDYIGMLLSIQGIVSRKIGGNVYIEQDGYGIYVFVGFTYTEKLKVGNEVLLSGVVATLFNDALQVSNFSSEITTIISEGITVTPTLVTLNDLSERYEGALVQINGLTITKIQSDYDSNGSYNIYAKDQSGTEIAIRVDGSLFPKIEKSSFSVGKQIDIIAPLGKHYENYQLMLSTIGDVTFKN